MKSKMVLVGGVRSELFYFKHIYRVFYMCGKLKITPRKNVEAFFNIWPALGDSLGFAAPKASHHSASVSPDQVPHLLLV